MNLLHIQPEHKIIADSMVFEHTGTGNVVKFQKVEIDYQHANDDTVEIIETKGAGRVFVNSMRENTEVIKRYRDYIIALSVKLGKRVFKAGKTTIIVVDEMIKHSTTDLT